MAGRFVCFSFLSLIPLLFVAGNSLRLLKNIPLQGKLKIEWIQSSSQEFVKNIKKITSENDTEKRHLLYNP
jgi:hypothetical protein